MSNFSLKRNIQFFAQINGCQGFSLQYIKKAIDTFSTFRFRVSKTVQQDVTLKVAKI